MQLNPAEISELIKSRIEGLGAAADIRNQGTVISVTDGIVRVHGLSDAMQGEMLEFPANAQGVPTYGLALNLERDSVGAVILGEYEHISEGDTVKTTGRILEVPVGPELVGRVVNALGQPIDGKGPIEAKLTSPIEKIAPGVIARESVSQPLQTGIKSIDSMVPIGRGQRELIIGDRQTGKTAVAIDAIINQRDKNVLCIYCAIGQRAASVAKVIANLSANRAMDYTIVVATEGDKAPGLKYIAPYAATSIAEYFMEQGRDVLIVYDDLTHHARAYRELSLLLRRPPGREAFPGDIFYIHSRLLERATHLNDKLGGGSLTALPIIETEAQNISAYIPTNLISITDGQIYLSPKLFEMGILPAVNVGKSVSRVGGKAQLPAYRSITGNLKLAYSQFEELENYARFGTRLDENTRKIIEHGKRIRIWLKQNELKPMPVPEQIVVLLALTNGFFDTIPIDKMHDAEAALLKSTAELPSEIIKRLFTDKELSKPDSETILTLARNTLDTYQDKPESEEKPDASKNLQPEKKPETEKKAELEGKSEPKSNPGQNQNSK